jgi:prophage regulatory protein
VAERIIRRPEVERRTGKTCARIYEEMKLGTFPQAVPIGKYAVGWVESEIDAWVEERIRARESQGVKPLRRKFEKPKKADQIGTEPQPV